jgi:hypothetical protein
MTVWGRVLSLKRALASHNLSQVMEENNAQKRMHTSQGTQASNGAAEAKCRTGGRLEWSTP